MGLLLCFLGDDDDLGVPLLFFGDVLLSPFVDLDDSGVLGAFLFDVVDIVNIFHIVGSLALLALLTLLTLAMISYDIVVAV